MPKRSGKPRVEKLAAYRDTNEMAKAVMDRIEALAEAASTPPPREKDPAAVALGRRGGLKGGKARMGSLTGDQRRKLALKGARARWGKKS